MCHSIRPECAASHVGKAHLSLDGASPLHNSRSALKHQDCSRNSASDHSSMTCSAQWLGGHRLRVSSCMIYMSVPEGSGYFDGPGLNLPSGYFLTTREAAIRAAFPGPAVDLSKAHSLQDSGCWEAFCRDLRTHMPCMWRSAGMSGLEGVKIIQMTFFTLSLADLRDDGKSRDTT